MGAINKRVEVARLFFEVGKNIKKSMRKDFEVDGLTMPQTMVIGTLIENGEMKMTELSSMLKLSNSTISGIIDRLEKQQLVIRTRSHEDRRTVYVSTTKKVEEFHQGIHKKLEKSFEDILSNGTPDEIEKIIIGLHTLKKILESRKE